MISGDLLNLLASVFLLILCSRLLGRLTQVIGQPSIVGEILAGVVLGPAVLDLIKPGHGLSSVSTVAVFMIVFSAGLEMEFGKVMKALRDRGVLIAFFSFAIPLGAGLCIGEAFQLGTLHSWMLGLVMSVTALPVAVRILELFGLLDSDVGSYTIVIAVVNDIAVFLALTLAMQATRSGGAAGMTGTALAALGKLAVLMGIIALVSRALHSMKPGRLGGTAGKVSAVLIVLAFGFVSTVLGFHFAIGVFFGALILGADMFGAREFEEFRGAIRLVTGRALAPVFFGCVGLATVVKGLPSAPFVVAVILLSVSSKIVAGWLGGLASGLSQRTSLGIGIVSNAKGVMGLVVASIALEKGLIDHALFSVLVIMDVATTILAPVFLKKWLQSADTADECSRLSRQFRLQ